MDNTALAALTARLKGMGYRGNDEQLVKLIVLAEQETKERLFLSFWSKFPVLRHFFDHAHKHDMFFIAADPTGAAAAKYVRASRDNKALRLTHFEVRDVGGHDHVLVKAIFTRKDKIVKVRNLMCPAK